MQVEGKKIKIKFSLKNPGRSNALIGEKPSCSSNGRVDSNQVPEQNCVLMIEGRSKVPLLPSCSVALVSEQKHGLARKEQCVSSSRTLSERKKIFKAALLYKTLLEDWLPPVLQPELNDDDNGGNWLLPRNQLGKLVAKRFDVNDVPCCASLISWPQAQYLPEGEIYALPYTVPF
ncbi:uncharacterized protein LOC120198279 [Hibiscus syriacus]|uniref:uncharacterized protein LOC120198279 n=1 Tax=Hibiscus syriacus TaxID=106335 RepID=UPI001920CCBE|nr:uncharacterized protein LOC120198279 [Hibiscus syriacus]